MNHFKKFLHLKIISRQSICYMYIGRCPTVALQAHQKKKKKKKKKSTKEADTERENHYSCVVVLYIYLVEACKSGAPLSFNSTCSTVAINQSQLETMFAFKKERRLDSHLKQWLASIARFDNPTQTVTHP